MSAVNPCCSNALSAKSHHEVRNCTRRSTRSWIVYWDVVAEDGTSAIIQNWHFCTFHANRARADKARFKPGNSIFLPLIPSGTKRIAMKMVDHAAR